jgi:hypothetical protein
MNMYQNLSFALEKNQYKRGQYKGDAPADPSRRSRSHIRIIKGNHTQAYNSVMAVRMYATDILKAFPDGTIEINLRGWGSSSTTRATINDALGTYRRKFSRMYLGSHSVFGLSQPSIHINGKVYLYYDGMTFDAEGTLLTEAKPFEARRIDTAESKEFAAEIKESGFKDMFPLLYATCSLDLTYVPPSPYRKLREMICADYSASYWSELIATFKYLRRWGQPPTEAGDAKSCWAAIMKQAKADMYVVLASSTTEITTGVTPKFSPATPATPAPASTNV